MKLIDTTRLVILQSDISGYEYFTHGGNVTLIEYKSRVYGLTCRHVIEVDKTVLLNDICILNVRNGGVIAGLKNVYTAKDCKGSELSDMCVIEFSDDVDNRFFNNTVYKFDNTDVSSVVSGSQLYAVGSVKDLSFIDHQTLKIKPQYIELPLFFDSVDQNDSTLNKTTGDIPNDWNMTRLTGMSGGAVFLDKKLIPCLVGIITRGSIVDGKAVLHYIDIKNYLKFLQMVIKN